MADPKLRISIGADLREIKQALATVTDDLRKLSDRANRPPAGVNAIEKAAAGARQELQRMQSSVRNLFAAIGAGFSIQSFIQLSDAAALINARLRLATQGITAYNNAQQQLFQIAQRTRNGLESTVELYGRLERSTRALNLTQEQLLGLTETISKTIALSGGGAGGEAALLQFAQLLSAGDLTAAAQEINSIQEQAPRLAEAIRSGLRKLGIEGPENLKKLVSEGGVQVVDLLRAIQLEAQAVDAEFQELPRSIGGGFTQIRNAFLQFLATSTEAQTGARAIANALQAIAQNLPALIDAFVRLGSVVAGYLAIFRALPALYRTLTTLSGGLAAANTTLAASFIAAGTAAGRILLALRLLGGAVLAFAAGFQIGTILRKQFLEVELFGIALVNGLLVLWERIKQGAEIALEAVKTAFISSFNVIRTRIADLAQSWADASSVFGDNRLSAAFEDLAKKIRPTNSAIADFRAEVDRINQETGDRIQQINDGFADLAQSAIDARKETEKAGNTPPPQLVTPPENAPAVLADRLAVEREEIQRALFELQRAYEQSAAAIDQQFRDRKISVAQFYADTTALARRYIDERTRLTLAANQVEQQAEERRVREGGPAAATALANLENLKRQEGEIRADAEFDFTRIQQQAEQQRTDAVRQAEQERLGIQVRALELRGETEAAAALQAAAQYRDAMRRAVAENDQAAIDDINFLIDQEKIDAQLQSLADRMQRALDNLRAQEQLIGIQLEAGQIGEVQAEQQIQAVRNNSISQLEQLRAAFEQVYNAAANGPLKERALQAMRDLDLEIGRVKISTEDFYDRLGDTAENAAVQSLADAFTDLVSGAKSFGDAVRDMARAFTQAITQMIAQELALATIRSLLRSFGGGAASTTASVAHSGSMAGQGIKRTVPAWVFAGAPRMHSGGMAGLAPNEVPAILQAGEEVLSRNDPRNAANGGRSARPAPGFRVVNVLDPALAADYIESAAGERTILNVIGRNPGYVKQALGVS